MSENRPKVTTAVPPSRIYRRNLEAAASRLCCQLQEGSAVSHKRAPAWEARGLELNACARTRTCNFIREKSLSSTKSPLGYEYKIIDWESWKVEGLHPRAVVHGTDLRTSVLVRSH